MPTLVSDAYPLIRAKLDAMHKDVEKWKELTVSADVPNAQTPRLAGMVGWVSTGPGTIIWPPS